MNNYIKQLVSDRINHYSYELYEMAQMGSFGKLYIIIFSNDPGYIPHFHILNHPNPKKATFKCCLKIETPEYFMHGDYKNILNSKQVKQLIEFLKSERFPNITRWQYMVAAWNDNNSKHSIPDNMPMPDYSTLNLKQL